MKPAPNLTPATFDEWLAGLDVRPPDQRPGQWAVNTLTPELWTAVNGTPFDAFHIGERLPDLIRYARHWWGVMEVSKDGASIPMCVWMAVKRGKVPGDDEDCAPELETDGPPGWSLWPDRFNRILARVADGFGTVEEEAEVRRTLFAVDDDHEDDDGEAVEMESP